MREMQLWQSDGLGTDRDTLEKVLRVFKSDGVQTQKSWQALNAYIRKLDNDALREMYEIDAKTTLQILIDCFGLMETLYKCTMILEYASVNTEELSKAGWVSPAIYAEVTAKYEKRIKKLNEDKEKVFSDYEHALREVGEKEDQVRELKNTLVYYKADLYDFYAQAGKLPKHEGR